MTAHIYPPPLHISTTLNDHACLFQQSSESSEESEEEEEEADEEGEEAAADGEEAPAHAEEEPHLTEEQLNHYRRRMLTAGEKLQVGG